MYFIEFKPMKFMEKREKILIIIGAGASLNFGMPSTNKISEILRNRHVHKIKDNIDLYNEIENKVTEYYNSSHKARLIKKTNYEEVLYVLYYLDTLYDPYNINPMLALIRPFNEESFIKNLKINIPQYSSSGLSNLLIDELLKVFRDKCKNIQTRYKNELNKLKDLLCKLSDKYEIGIISLNYDDIFYQAKPDLFTGFNSFGEFSPIETINRKEWNFIYNIHGSVHFNMEESGNELHKIFWRDLNYKYSGNSFGRNLINTTEGIALPNSVIITGYEKAIQLQRMPFRTYYSVLDRLIFEADKFLIIGYGFADFHINNALNLMNENRKRNVLIIDYSDDSQDPIAMRNNNFTYNLFKTITANGYEFVGRNSDYRLSAEEFKKNKEFEVSKNPDYPLSFWHNGFKEICNNPKLLLNELKL